MTPNSTRKIGLSVLFICEMLERFSYYGMRAIIVLFAIDSTGLGLSNTEALHYYSILTMAVFTVPLPLGVLVDFLLKHTRGVIVGGIITTAGYFLISISTHDINQVFIGLCLVVVGVGLVKPSLTILVGRMFHKTDSKRDAAYIIFYMFINIGALLSSLVVTLYAEQNGWDEAFRLVSIAMLISTVIFLVGKQFIQQIELEEEVIEEIDVFKLEKTQMQYSSDETNVHRFLLIMGLVVLVGVFWVGFEVATQVYISAIQTLTDNDFTYTYLGFEWEARSLQSLSIMFLLPCSILMIFYIYSKKAVNTATKVSIAFLLFAGSMLVLLPIAKENVLTSNIFDLLMISYVLNTLAEVFISPIALSYITRLSANNVSSIMMGVYFLFVGICNKLVWSFQEYLPEDNTYLLSNAIAIFIAIGLILMILNKKLTKLTGGIES